MRMLGYRWRDRHSARFTWGEVSRGSGIGLELNHFEENWSIHVRTPLGQVYVNVAPSRSDPHDIVDSWGIDWNWVADLREAVHVSWGDHTTFLHFPWAWEHARTSYLMADGVTWANERDLRKSSTAEFWSRSDDPRLWREVYPYTYRLKNGEAQERTATVTVHEMEHRWRALQWSPFPRIVRRWIDVWFSDEVGERTGSWKGGTLGCGYDLRDGETPGECLRRMERERVFN